MPGRILSLQHVAIQLMAGAAVVSADFGLVFVSMSAPACQYTPALGCRSLPCPGTDAKTVSLCVQANPPCPIGCKEKTVAGASQSLCALASASSAPFDAANTATYRECIQRSPTTDVCNTTIAEHLAAAGCDDDCRTAWTGRDFRGDVCATKTTKTACEATTVPCGLDASSDGPAEGPTQIERPPSGQGTNDVGASCADDLGYCHFNDRTGNCQQPFCPNHPFVTWQECAFSSPPCPEVCAEKPVADAEGVTVCAVVGSEIDPIDRATARAFVQCFGGTSNSDDPQCPSVFSEYARATGCGTDCFAALNDGPRNEICDALPDDDRETCVSTWLLDECPNYPQPVTRDMTPTRPGSRNTEVDDDADGVPAEDGGFGVPADDSGSSITGPAIGGTVGAFVLLALCAASAAYFVWSKRRKLQHARRDSAHGNPVTDDGGAAGSDSASHEIHPRGIGVAVDSEATEHGSVFMAPSAHNPSSGAAVPHDAYRAPLWAPSQHNARGVSPSHIAQAWSPATHEHAALPLSQQQQQPNLVTVSSDVSTEASSYGAQPPRTGSRYTTIYQIPSMLRSTADTRLATVLDTQRPVPGVAAMLAAEAQHDQLVKALQAMAHAKPPEQFMGKYLIMRERVSGGQATVQFVRGSDGDFFQYAVKFFTSERDFHIEVDAYSNQAIKSVLPPLFDANTAGAVCSLAGYPFPSYMVMERGLTLAQWLKTRRDPLGILCMFKDCATLLATLHGAGRVHRDLKPDNVLSMLQSQEWKLIDFGIAAPMGQETPPQCTLGYAAPEVVIAFDDKRAVAVDAAHDVWALGVMVFEAFTRVPGVDPFRGAEGAKQLARGELQYPWEVAEFEWPFGGVRARRVVLSCLVREPAARPTAAALVQSISLITDQPEAIE